MQSAGGFMLHVVYVHTFVIWDVNKYYAMVMMVFTIVVNYFHYRCTNTVLNKYIFFMADVYTYAA